MNNIHSNPSKYNHSSICLSKKHLFLVVILIIIISFISLSSIALNTNKSLSSKAATNDVTTKQQVTCPKSVLCGNNGQSPCDNGGTGCCSDGFSIETVGAVKKCSSSSGGSPQSTSVPQPTVTVSSIPTTPPETVAGDYCRNKGCACRNTQDCNGPNLCVKGYFEEAPNYVCSTPQIFFSQLGSNDGV